LLLINIFRDGYMLARWPVEFNKFRDG
jgi:hypothetical protein